MDIKKLIPYSRNPRTWTQEDEEILGDSLEDLGDVSGITFNHEHTICTGHRRFNYILDKYSEDENYNIVYETVSTEYNEDTGTIGYGYIVVRDLHGEEVFRHAWRQVDWDEESYKFQKALLISNKITEGKWSNEILETFDPSMLEEVGFDLSEFDGSGFASKSEFEENDSFEDPMMSGGQGSDGDEEESNDLVITVVYPEDEHEAYAAMAALIRDNLPSFAKIKSN